MEKRSKHEMLRVEALRMGDKFAFLNQPTAEAGPATMIVTRSPAVNQAANSCHFRYQPQGGAGAAVSANGWQDNQSWNGAPGVLVQLLDRSPVDPPEEAASPATAAPRKKK
jgi:hypothetical protein